MKPGFTDSRRLLPSLIGDGRPLLNLFAIGLGLAGAFALFLSLSGSFLPHDVAWLGLRPEDLCARGFCPVVHFMFHDRVAFGGVLIAISILYLWLIHFPLQEGEAWAWWTLVISGLAGFASFLSYLGYGYLDTWHALATIVLLFIYVWGLFLAWKSIEGNRSIFCLRQPAEVPQSSGTYRLGRGLLLFTSLGKIMAGFVIMVFGMTVVFVPQDLQYMGLNPSDLNLFNPRLIPLIAHDRAGFGGSLISCGLLVGLIVWKGPPSPHLWEALLLAGGTGFLCAIGVHFWVGYTDFTHLAPAFVGFLIFLAGMALTFRRMVLGR